MVENHILCCINIFSLKFNILHTSKSFIQSYTQNLPMTMNERTTCLSGLLAHYDSDSEHEDTVPETKKLDAKVDDFLQEINQLASTEAPEAELKQETDKMPTCAWQECFDKRSGYPYYWNIQSNAVTWEVPEEYKLWLTQTKLLEIKSQTTLASANSKKEQVVNTIPVKIPDKVKNVVRNRNKKPNKKPLRISKQTSDSEDERIVLITSFSDGDSSESEHEVLKKKEIIKPESFTVMGPHIEDIPKEMPIEKVSKKEIVENIKKENVDETVILARLKTQAKVLQELGGELPKSVEKTIIEISSEKLKPQSLALVAGYGADSDQEEEDDANVLPKSLFPIPPAEQAIPSNGNSQSTLFPTTKPIDIKQFELPNEKPTAVSKFQNPKETDKSHLDIKVFKRKKRLGIAFEKRLKTSNPIDSLEEERKGFGFQSAEDKISPFKKGSIAFVKTDVLNPTLEIKPETSEKYDGIDDFDDIRNTITEKVNFLGEGNVPVSAVQVMSVQLQTLEAAYKASALTKKYLYSWLRETYADLEKLEVEAAPEGWKCIWDRSNKRYFYRNMQSGETQWEFPDPDIVGGGEAMDICTTPPPNEEGHAPEIASRQTTPSPPLIKERSKSPPPPPIISKEDTRHITTPADEVQPPMPSLPPPVEIVPPPPPSISDSQPLPPGVDIPELPDFVTKKENETSNSSSEIRDSIGMELDSFYSDLAQIEATQGVSTDKAEIESVPSPASIEENSNDVILKKKKKSKKLGQGANMKKKAVSSLVEKWKKVQNDYL